MFPIIDTIEDVLCPIAGKDEFKVSKNSGYTVIDYQIQKEDTFDSPQALEARGIKFHPDGTIAARLLHKKFNKGQYPELDKEYLQKPFRMLEKLDGSELHFLPVDGELRAMTKAGVTDVSKQCEQEVDFHPDFWSALQDMLDLGLTPIFEYTSPNNRIVIRYDEPQITLIAVRDTVTGEYQHLDDYSKILHVPRVREYTGSIEDVKDWTEKEGVVLVWEDGHRVKCKSEDYILKHRTKDSISQEKNVLALVLDDSVDDLANILDETDYNHIQNYHTSVWNGIHETAAMLASMVSRLRGMERKEVALTIKEQLAGSMEMPVFWKIFDGADPVEATVSLIKKNLTNQAKVDKVRPLFKAEY